MNKTELGAVPNIVAEPVPELGVTPGVPLPAGAGFHDKQGCGCESSDPTGPIGVGLALGALAVLNRKRKQG
jgi:MYXO-CTERM domain-containing protein